MIIDARTHVWSSLDQLGTEAARRLRQLQVERWGQLDAGPAAHEQATMCVSAAFVLGFRSDRTGARIPNEYVAQVVASNPGRLLGVGGIDPMGSDPLDHLEAAIGLGMVGISVAPMLQGFHPAHSTAMRIYERCVEVSMPVFVVVPHPLTTSAEMEFGHTSLWDEVARTFPDLKLVIGELGYPWIDETLVLAGKHGNVYTELSGVVTRPWQLYNALQTAWSLDVMDRLLFGSGFPFEAPAKAIETMYSINAFAQGSQLPSVPRSAIRSIVERDTLAVLGLEDTLPAGGRGGRPASDPPARAPERHDRDAGSR